MNMIKNAPAASPQVAHGGEPSNPALSDVVERNTRTILRLRATLSANRRLQDRIADAITAISGRLAFVYIHMLWFGGWILLNTGWFGVKVFDPFPYGLLTMVVSLEAIFLSTFVLINAGRPIKSSSGEPLRNAPKRSVEDSRATVAYCPIAMTSSPATMRPPPAILGKVRLSPSNAHAGASATTTLPLSMRATVDTWPTAIAL